MSLGLPNTTDTSIFVVIQVLKYHLELQLKVPSPVLVNYQLKKARSNSKDSLQMDVYILIVSSVDQSTIPIFLQLRYQMLQNTASLMMYGGYTRVQYTTSLSISTCTPEGLRYFMTKQEEMPQKISRLPMAATI